MRSLLTLPIRPFTVESYTARTSLARLDEPSESDKQLWKTFSHDSLAIEGMYGTGFVVVTCRNTHVGQHRVKMVEIILWQDGSQID